MKILTIIAACLYYSGLVRLGRWRIGRMGPRLIILNYHSATPGDLRGHLLYLRRHYRVLHLEDALEELFSPAVHPVRDRRTLLAITFDDGYYDNYTYCFPLVRELRIPITLFLIPGYVETGERFWWREPEYLVTHAEVGEVTVEGQRYRLDRSGERKALVQAIDRRIRFASSVEEREAYLREVRQLLAVPCAVGLEEKSSLPISWAEVEKLEGSEWVTLGGHTMHHPLLAYLTDASEAEYEVGASRRELEQHLHSSVKSFAYPVGKLGDIGEQGMRSAQKAGYAWAVTTVSGINTPQSNPYLLHRFGVDVRDHWLILAAKACGLWDMFVILVKFPLRFARASNRGVIGKI